MKALLWLAAAACCTESAATESDVIGFEIVATYPHDRAAFTQGLVFDGDTFLESTGGFGSSSLRRVAITTGEVQQRVMLASSHFGEGLALLAGRIFQLTWQSETCFLYAPADFATQGELAYDGEGWGLTHDGTSLIMSDGTNRLRYRDPATFAVQRTLNVVDGGTPVRQLNELEWVRGEIWANVWHDKRIARIDPATGAVRGWLDLSELYPPEVSGDSEAVLNGIAYDAGSDRVFVTGKRWPVLYELRLSRR